MSPNSLDLTHGAEVTAEQVIATYHAVRCSALRVYKCEEVAEMDEDRLKQFLSDLKNVLNALGLTEFLETMLEAEEIA